MTTTDPSAPRLCLCGHTAKAHLDFVQTANCLSCACTAFRPAAPPVPEPVTTSEPTDALGRDWLDQAIDTLILSIGAKGERGHPLPGIARLKLEHEVRYRLRATPTPPVDRGPDEPNVECVHCGAFRCHHFGRAEYCNPTCLDRGRGQTFAVERGPEGIAALVDAPDTLRWKLTLAKSALENWGRHHHWCSYLHPISEGGIAEPCNCGYEQTVRDADPVNVANGVSGANLHAAQGVGTLVAALVRAAREAGEHHVAYRRTGVSTLYQIAESQQEDSRARLDTALAALTREHAELRERADAMMAAATEVNDRYIGGSPIKGHRFSNAIEGLAVANAAMRAALSSPTTHSTETNENG
jgi:hypothetical protein